VELLVASTICAILLVTIYSAFRIGLRSHKNIEESINIHQAARVAFGQINLDIRNAFVYKKDDVGFLGEKNKFSFFTLVDNYRQGKIVRDYAFVTYTLEEDRLMRLYLYNQDYLENTSGMQGEEIISDIEKIVFSYGFLDTNDKTLKFKESWNDKTNLPQAIKVELSLNGKIKKDFSRTIYLP